MMDCVNCIHAIYNYGGELSGCRIEQSYTNCQEFTERDPSEEPWEIDDMLEGDYDNE